VPILPIGVGLILLTAWGCYLPRWRETPPFSKPYDEVLAAAKKALRTNHFMIESLDRENGALETRWREQYSIMWKGGTRDKVVMRFIHNKDQSITVRLRCIKEYNEETVDPSNPSKARWYPAGQDTNLEQSLLRHIRLALYGLER